MLHAMLEVESASKRVDDIVLRRKAALRVDRCARVTQNIVLGAYLGTLRRKE